MYRRIPYTCTNFEAELGVKSSVSSDSGKRLGRYMRYSEPSSFFLRVACLISIKIYRGKNANAIILDLPPLGHGYFYDGQIIVSDNSKFAIFTEVFSFS